MSCLDNNCPECLDCVSTEPAYADTGCTDCEGGLTTCITHNGDNGSCVPYVKNEKLSSILHKFDAKFCDFAAGTDRRVSINQADSTSGFLQDKVLDSTYIKWTVVDDSGVSKLQASLDLVALTDAICTACALIVPVTTTTTSTTSSTTTLPATTTTTSTSSTTTPFVNVEVQNATPGATITNLSGTVGFNISGSIVNGGEQVGHHNSFGGSVAVTIAASTLNASLILRKNGVDIQCVPVNGGGTFTFSPVPFIVTDRATIVLVNTPCASITTTTTTTSTTTTLPATTTTSTTTTFPINVIIQNTISGTSITSVSGIASFILPETVEAGEVITGHHTSFASPVTVTIFGTITNSKLVLTRNGVMVQCIDIAGQGTSTFNAFTFTSSDVLQISLLAGPCAPATTTSTTTTLPACKTYRLTNLNSTDKTMTYKGCDGTNLTAFIPANDNITLCAQAGSFGIVANVSITLLNNVCDTCYTYTIGNTSGSTQTFSYTDCNTQDTVFGSISNLSTIQVCATRDSVVVDGSPSGTSVSENSYGCTIGGTTTTSTTTTAAVTTTSTTTTASGPTTTSTTTTGAPSLRVYYGKQTSSTPPSSSTISSGASILVSSLSSFVVNWGVIPVAPNYYYFAIPAGADLTTWFQSITNNGSIGTPSDLFDAPTTITILGQPHELYMTVYATQFEDSANYTFAV